MIVEDDDEDVPEVVQPEPRNKGKSKATASPSVNGKPSSRGKGKGRAASTTNGHKSISDLVVVEELDDDDPPVAKPPIPSTKGNPPATSLDLVEEGEIPEGLDELGRTKEERDLVRFPPLLSPYFGILNGLCCTVQSQERETL
jgi:hypothetical protein